MQNSYIEFRIKDTHHFELLCSVFQALREAKQTDNFQNDDYWLAFFDKEALSHFGGLHQKKQESIAAYGSPHLFPSDLLIQHLKRLGILAH